MSGQPRRDRRRSSFRYAQRNGHASGHGTPTALCFAATCAVIDLCHRNALCPLTDLSRLRTALSAD